MESAVFVFFMCLIVVGGLIAIPILSAALIYTIAAGIHSKLTFYSGITLAAINLTFIGFVVMALRDIKSTIHRWKQRQEQPQ